jgi:hypothetical protein
MFRGRRFCVSARTEGIIGLLLTRQQRTGNFSGLQLVIFACAAIRTGGAAHFLTGRDAFSNLLR